MDPELNDHLFPYSCDEPIPLFYIKTDEAHSATPFKHVVTLAGYRGRITATATADGGGMLNVIDLTFWLSIDHAMGRMRSSRARARVADGTVVRSTGRWVGEVQLGPVRAVGGFEIMDCKGSFEVLLGKPWLAQAQLCHDFAADELRSTDGAIRIPNGAKQRAPTPRPPPPPAPLHDDAPAAALRGPAQSPHSDAAQQTAPEPAKHTCTQPSGSRFAVCVCVEAAVAGLVGMPLATDIVGTDAADLAAVERATDTAPPRPTRSTRRARKAAEREARELEELVLREAMRRAEDARQAADEELLAVFDDAQAVESGEALPGVTALDEVLPTLFAIQSTMAPARAPEISMAARLAPERVARVLAKVGIGEDLSAEQRGQVDALVREFADVFTLSLNEVRLVDFIEHKLGIPAGTEGPRTANQKPLSEPQREWLYKALDEMEACDIVRRIPASAAKWVSAITLAPKDKGKAGLSIDELRRRANDECVKAGLPPMWEEVAVTQEKSALLGQGGNGISDPPAKAKWRLCHNFIALNRLSRQSSFPMGDLETKQQRVAGHRWICIADFMAGFNAVPVAADDIAYTAFAVPGRGLYVTPRMCFGMTGAPNTFCEMVAMALDGLTGDIVETWMDDCALWGDEFGPLLANLRRFFARCRERKLSLSAEKTQLFMSEATFAGVRVSSAGVKPGLAKIAAILDWPEPTNALEVLGFTGLTGHFRAIIKDYARIARPLTDLTRDIRPNVPKGAKAPRGAYKRALARESVGWRWGLEERQAFARLKSILTSEPVLKPPQYDRPFIVTTDGSKVGFGATLTQRWCVPDSAGKLVEREFPVAYASKRTSRTEERYSPYLLEFAAMKFALDKFDKIIFGQPIELVTDCRALRDTLNNDELSSTHTRWMESIIARRIIEVRHRPGVDNQADGLSRKWISCNDRDVDGGLDSVVADWESKDTVPDLFTVLVEGDANARLRERFAEDPYFRDVVEWLTAMRVDPALSPKQALRARMRARDYFVKDGKLWRMGGKHAHRAPKVECVPAAEGRELAADCHAHGHWGRDVCEETLRTRYFWPNMRRDIVHAIQTCSPCKAFGTRHIVSLLEPLTRARPFQMITADYLSMPVGKGKFRTILLFIDIFTRFTWGFKTTKKAGTGAYTVEGLQHIKGEYQKPELFATDGGRHFDCEEVRKFCADNGIEYTKTPPYSPWANGLVEDCNRILLGRLRRYCQPDFSADETGMSASEMAAHMPAKWPDYFAQALEDMNSRTLPSLGYSPRELLFGMALTDVGAAPTQGTTPATQASADKHIALVDTLRADGHARTLRHAAARKRRFDAHVDEVVFETGDFVQVYNDRLDGTLSTERKLAAKWSGPMKVVARYLGSWKVRPWGSDNEDDDIYVSGRRLRKWIPARGTALYKAALEKERRRAAMDLEAGR